MIECLYTAQKMRKNKIWKDGFLKIKENGKTELYNLEGGLISSFKMKEFFEEFDIGKYIIQVDEEEINRYLNKEEKIIGINKTGPIEKIKYKELEIKECKKKTYDVTDLLERNIYYKRPKRTIKENIEEEQEYKYINENETTFFANKILNETHCKTIRKFISPKKENASKNFTSPEKDKIDERSADEIFKILDK